MSLRYRLSDITERAPIGRPSWFITPMRLSVVVAGLAVLALALLLWPRGDVGPGPNESATPSQSQSQSQSVEPSASSEPTPTLVPTAEQPTTAPTVLPTPVPTTAPSGDWTGLVWSDPVTPSFPVHLYDLVPWGEGYVAIGDAPGRGPWVSLTSSDGLDWTIRQHDFRGAPRHLLTVDDELLAFLPEVWPDQSTPPGGAIGGPPTSEVWRSTDGATWSVIESPTWNATWQGLVPGVTSPPLGWDPAQHDVTIGLVDVASGPAGLVAIGNSFGDDAMAPIILHSTDGAAWTSTALPTGSDSALLNAVVEHDGRFVITGATGVWTDPSTAVGAAWYSDDGVTWVRATVDRDAFPAAAGYEFGPLWAGDDGLLTCSGNREMAAGGWRYMIEWLSTDGASWHVAPNLDENPGCSWAAADGTRIIALGPRPGPPEWPGITHAWSSTDGLSWQSLRVEPALTDMLERFWIVPDGVIYAGEQSFWFGTPTFGP